MTLCPLPRLAGLWLCFAATAFMHDAGSPHDIWHHADTPAPRPIRITLDADGRVNPWNHLAFHNDPNAFQFAIVSDRTGGARAGVFEDAIRKLNLLQPEFVMSVGDLIEGYSTDEAEVNAQWDEFQDFIRELEMPFFYVPGNHDQSNPVMARLWRERFGRSHYSFVYRDVLFLCLNSQEPAQHHIGPDQAQWVRDTLAAHTDVRWTLVFLHTPLWEYGADRGWPAIEAALQGRDYTVFAGHYHTYLKNERHDSRYYILATTGGGSSLRGPAYGEFDQVGWVTMTAGGPVLANLMLDGIRDDNIRTVQSKTLADAVLGGALTTDVLWVPHTGATAPRLALLAANPTDTPLTLALNLAPASGLDVTLLQGLETMPDGRRTLTLQPRSSRALTLQLDGALPEHAFQARSAGSLHWEARLQPEGQPAVQLEDRFNLPIVPRLPLPRALRPLTADGDPADWAGLPVYDVAGAPFLDSSSKGWTGPADCTFRVAFAHDDAHLHVLVTVRDDEIIALPDVPPWKQDGIELRIDFRDPAHHRTSRTGEGGLFFIGSCPAPDDGTNRAYVTYGDSLPAGTKLSNRRTDDGYVFELALPLAGLATKHGTAWQLNGLRVNVAVNDRDGTEQAQLWWQPDWRTSANVPASGTLFWE